MITTLGVQGKIKDNCHKIKSQFKLQTCLPLAHDIPQYCCGDIHLSPPRQSLLFFFFKMLNIFNVYIHTSAVFSLYNIDTQNKK